MVAGEASGDLLGAHLITALARARCRARGSSASAGRRCAPRAWRCCFRWRSSRCAATSRCIRHYLEIVGIRRRLARHFLREPPALFIGVDAPDFNLDLEVAAEARPACRPCTTSAPRSGRGAAGASARSGARSRRCSLVFPFEVALYERAGVPVAYVGHPLADMLADVPGRERDARAAARCRARAKVIALLPGSRVSELEQMGGLFVRHRGRGSRAAVPDVRLPRAARDPRDAGPVRGGAAAPRNGGAAA